MTRPHAFLAWLANARFWFLHREEHTKLTRYLRNLVVSPAAQPIRSDHKHTRLVLKVLFVRRRAEHRHNTSLEVRLQSLFAKLMGPNHRGQIIALQELPHRVLPIRADLATPTLSEHPKVLGRVRPQEILEKRRGCCRFVAVNWSLERLNLVERVKVLGEAAVDAKVLVVDCGSEWELAEHLVERGDKFRSGKHLCDVVEEAVLRVHVKELVVSADHVDVLGETVAECEEQGDHFDAEVPAVDIVAEEEVSAHWRKPELFEDSEEVVEVSVEVSDHDELAGQAEKRWLGGEIRSGFVAEVLEELLVK